MTEENPKRPKTTPRFCDRCAAPIMIEVDERDNEILTCACDRRRIINPDELPEEWSG